MQRRWRADERDTLDVDTICGPETVVVRRTRKVKAPRVKKVNVKVNKNCRKCQDNVLAARSGSVMVVEEHVTFKQRDGREVSFNCGRGNHW